jgi:hypothetical protein
MAKLSKSILKEIVKECIVEIFAESFFDKSTSDEIINESFSRQNSRTRHNTSSPKRPKPSQNTQSRSKHLDSITFGKSESQKKEAINQQTQQSISRLTNDPVMSEIFKDTASSTLREQVGADSQRGMSIKSGGDAAALKAYNSDPTELFSESASKWAQLAFADPVKK